MELRKILNRMLNHEELSREETKEILIGITKSEFPNEQITALLTGLQMRGITVDLKSDFYYYLNVMDYAQEAINQHKKYR